METEDTSAAQTAASALPHPEIDLAPETLEDYDYLLNNFFIVDPKTSTSAQQLNAAAFLARSSASCGESPILPGPNAISFSTVSSNSWCSGY